MKRFINALCYTHHALSHGEHVTYSNGRTPRVRAKQPRWARNAPHQVRLAVRHNISTTPCECGASRKMVIHDGTTLYGWSFWCSVHEHFAIIELDEVAA